MKAPPPRPAARRLYCVLSARSLPYAQHAFRSLFAHALEDIDLTLITDGEEDRTILGASMQSIALREGLQWRIATKQEADERSDAIYAGFPALRAFREGHPCWRKITDPPLFAAPGEEMVILDPDLYFPNRFAFEATPATGIALMWQRPHCLLPDKVVMAAYNGGLRLAHHVDIGVAQWRNAFDPRDLEQIIRILGGAWLPRKMHVEAIVWAALAMRVGGGYLDPKRWSCWRNSQWKRIARKVGVPGAAILASEEFAAMKCFHGGGIAKWWIPDRVAAGGFAAPATLAASSALRPFETLPRESYEAGQRLKGIARRLGYYRLLAAEA